jgi:hypothetical protein
LFIVIGGSIYLTIYFSRYFLFSVCLLYLFSGLLARFAYALKRRRPNAPTYEPESRVDLA